MPSKLIHRITSYCALLLLAMISCASLAKPLPGDQAFKLSVNVSDANTLQASWYIAPGYYLYRKGFKLKIKDPKEAKIGLLQLPDGESKLDKTFGRVTIYRNQVTIPVPVLGLQPGGAIIDIEYQGCADSGFCYPPTTMQYALHFDNNNALIAYEKLTPGSTKPTSHESHLAKLSPKQLLTQQSVWLMLLGFLGFGLLLSFTPCVFPMIPVLSGIIVGHGDKITTRKALMLSIIYVLSMALVYAMLGVVFAMLGKNLQVIMQNPWVIAAFSGIFVLLALSMFGFYELQLPSKWQGAIAKVSRSDQHGAYLHVAIMGALSTLILSPCTTAPLVGALTYIAASGNMLYGGLALFTMGIGMGIPLLVVGASAGKLLPHAGKWMNAVKGFFGVLLLAVAIYLLSRIIPAALSLFLYGALLIVSAIYCGALRVSHESNTQKLSQGLGLVILVYGASLIIGASMGHDDPLRPLANHKTVLNLATPTSSASGSAIAAAATASANKGFTLVKSVKDVENQIAAAKLAGKPIMLDFFAEWCTTCKEMDRSLFPNPEIIKALGPFIKLRADVTANDMLDQQLQKHFGVIAPPAILFFDANGKEVSDARLVGDVDKAPLLKAIGEIAPAS